MSVILAQDWIVIPAVGIIVFLVCYMWADKVIAFLHNKSLGRRDEVMALMNMMHIEVDRKRMTYIMLLSSFGFGLLMFMVAFPNLVPGLLLGAVATIGGAQLPSLIVKTLYDRRCRRFTDQMVDGMTIMANGIRSGLSVTQSMERVVELMPNPMAQEFDQVLAEMRVGKPLEEALNDLGDRIPRPDVQMFVLSVNILQETGGNLAETFQTIVYTVRERQKIEKKIEALTAQGISQGVIITLVPFALLVVFLVVDPSFVMPLFNTTLGVIALLATISLQVIGGLMIRKIVKINV